MTPKKEGHVRHVALILWLRNFERIPTSGSGHGTCPLACTVGPRCFCRTLNFPKGNMKLMWESHGSRRAAAKRRQMQVYIYIYICIHTNFYICSNLYIYTYMVTPPMKLPLKYLAWKIIRKHYNLLCYVMLLCWLQP